MSRKDLSITIRNLTVDQYSWIEKEAKRTGQTISAVFKLWVQLQVDEKKEVKNALQKQY